MKFVNLTPHAIHLIDSNNQMTTFMPDGTVARVSMTSTVVSNFNGIEIITQKPGPVVGLPDVCQDVIWIVSAMVRLACPARLDLVSPGDLVRDDQGNIVGCRNFVMNFGD